MEYYCNLVKVGNYIKKKILNVQTIFSGYICTNEKGQNIIEMFFTFICMYYDKDIHFINVLF